MIKSPMVPNFFCRLELPQLSYCPIKARSFFMKYVFFTKFYNSFVLKISTRTIMPGFCKSGHIFFIFIIHFLLRACAKFTSFINIVHLITCSFLHLFQPIICQHFSYVYSTSQAVIRPKEQLCLA